MPEVEREQKERRRSDLKSTPACLFARGSHAISAVLINRLVRAFFNCLRSRFLHLLSGLPAYTSSVVLFCRHHYLSVRAAASPQTRIELSMLNSSGRLADSDWGQTSWHAGHNKSSLDFTCRLWPFSLSGPSPTRFQSGHCLFASIRSDETEPAPRPNSCSRSRFMVEPGQDLNDCTVLHLHDLMQTSPASPLSSMLCCSTCTCWLFVITTAPFRRLISAFPPCAAPVAPNPFHWKRASAYALTRMRKRWKRLQEG